MIRDYVSNGSDSGVSLSCLTACRVIEGNTWEDQLATISNSIVFIDEGNSFVSSEHFAGHVKEGKNYYVLVTRESLKNLPYSITEIYGIKSSGKYNDLEPVYHETYRIYEEKLFDLTFGDKRNKLSQRRGVTHAFSLLRRNEGIHIQHPCIFQKHFQKRMVGR